MNRKKVLIINEIMSGGTGIALLNLLNNIDKQKYQVNLLVLTRYGELYDYIPTDIQVDYLFKPIKSKNKFIQKLWKILKVRIVKYLMPIIFRVKGLDNCDSMVAWTPGLPTIALQNVKHVNKISWVHGDVEKYFIGKTKRVLEQYKSYKNIICVSEDARSSFSKKYTELSNKTKVIHNIIDAEKIRELSSEQVNEQEMLRNNSVKIVAVGRLATEKRFDLLILAHKKLIQQGYKINTVIIGDGPLKEDLEKRIENNNLGESIKLVGYKKNPYKYMNLADIFVLCSDFEGFALVVGEAMILRKPVISTCVAGPKEIIGDNEFGILVECNNVTQLSNAIITLIKNKKLRQDLSEKGVQRAQIFKSENIIPQIYELFG